MPWLSGCHHHASPNEDARPDATIVDLLVIHYISLPPGRFSGDAVVDLFLNRLDVAAHPAFAPLQGLRVSVHFLIRRSGRVLQFVDTDRRAWHAGASAFAGRERCNDFSIGIELEGDGEHRFTHAQYRRLARLTRRLAAAHPLRYVAGHSDVAPGRKVDPGPCFDWPRYLEAIAACGLRRPVALN
ncbi:MAG: 1,6-anhydro-N-acetylmuramyl-L-alanine amidase AmpD [Burkholderiaceae bacterium]